MKKIYVTPLNRVKDLCSADGILLTTSGMEGKGFDTQMSDSGANEGAGEDFARENNRNPSIWDQGW